MSKVTFTMTPNENRPKHSTRFDFETLESGTLDTSKFHPSFYVPKPLAEKAKRIRVTIEEI